MIATIQSREAYAQMIAEALRNYRGPIEVCKPCPINPKPANFRRDWIDPEARLIRKKPLSKARKDQLAELAARKQLPPEDRPPTMAELALKHGISRSTLQRRLSMGMSMAKALEPASPSMARRGKAAEEYRARQMRNKAEARKDWGTV